jgi:hypothetical protein
MFSSEGGYSLADIAAATNRNNNDGFGGGAWWIIILFLFVFMGGGWDGNGFGGGNAAATAAASGALTRADLCQDMNFQGVENGVRGIQQGLCDGFYAMNTNILNGFNGVDNAVCSLGYQTQQGFNDLAMNNTQNTNAITSQLTNLGYQNQQNAFEIQKGIEQGFCNTNYNMASQFCETRQAICDSTRSILDFLTQDKIATLTTENASLKAAASNAAQTTEIINQLKPCPSPAYIVSNPYCSCAM